VGVVSGVLGFFSDYIFKIVTKETKEVFISISASDNLAALPASPDNNLEVILTLPDNQKQMVKSLFKYSATIKNTPVIKV
jgi:hypothetical protein